MNVLFFFHFFRKKPSDVNLISPVHAFEIEQNFINTCLTDLSFVSAYFPEPALVGLNEPFTNALYSHVQFLHPNALDVKKLMSLPYNCLNG